MKPHICVKVVLGFLLLDAFTCGTLVRITGLKCHVVDPAICNFENCVMKPVRRGVKEVNMVVKLLQPPVNNASLRVDILRRGDTTQSLYHFEIDCCKFIVSKRRNPIAKAIYSFLRLETYSNVNHSCPYNHDLIVKHLRFDKDLNLLLPLGRGEYVMKMYWKIYNVLCGIIDVNMHITD